MANDSPKIAQMTLRGLSRSSEITRFDREHISSYSSSSSSYLFVTVRTYWSLMKPRISVYYCWTSKLTPRRLSGDRCCLHICCSNVVCLRVCELETFIRAHLVSLQRLTVFRQIFLSIWRGVSAIGSRRYTTQLSVGLRHTVHSSSAATIGLHIYVSLTPRVTIRQLSTGRVDPRVGSGRVLK